MTFVPASPEEITAAKTICVSYRRVSTGPQAAKGTSLESQLDRHLQAAEAMSAPIVADFPEPGVSGALFRRPGIQQGVAEVRRLKAKYRNKTVMLLMTQIDRSGREVRVCRMIRDAVRLAGGICYFCDGMNFDYSAAGEFGFNVFAAAAQHQRDLIREMTMRGRRKRAEQGQQPYRVQHPFGYIIMTRADTIRGTCTESEEGTYRIDEEKARWARLIFDRLATGCGSLRSIAEWLNSEGVPTAKGAKKWGHSTVNAIVRNSVYRGVAIVGKTEAMFDEDRIDRGLSPYYTRPAEGKAQIFLTAPAIVTEAVWDAANAQVSSNASRSSGNPDYRYLLTGWMRCPVCGGKMHGRTTQAGNIRIPSGLPRDVPFTAYTCAAMGEKLKDGAGERRCRHGVSYPSTTAETLFARCLAELIQRSEMTDAAAAAWERHERESRRERTARRGLHPTAQRMEEIAATLNILTAKQDTAVSAQMRAIERGLDDSRYLAVLDGLQAEERALKAESEHLVAQGAGGVEEPPIELIVNRIQSVTQWMRERGTLVLTNLTSPDLTVTDKRESLDALVRSIDTDLRLTPEGKDALRVDLTLGGSLLVEELYSERPPTDRRPDSSPASA